MKLVDAFCYVGSLDDDGVYIFKNKTFIGWTVEFTKRNWDIEKIYKLHNAVINNFEESCDDYRKLMAMLQSDIWELDGIKKDVESPEQ